MKHGERGGYRRVLRAEIGARLKAAIAATGLSQNAVGRLLKVSSSTVSGWAKGRTQPSLEEFAALCYSLGLSPGQILGVEDPPKRKRQPNVITKGGVRELVAKSALAMARYDEAAKRARLSEAEKRLGEFAHGLVEQLAALTEEFESSEVPRESSSPKAPQK